MKIIDTVEVDGKRSVIAQDRDSQILVINYKVRVGKEREYRSAQCLLNDGRMKQSDMRKYFTVASQSVCKDVNEAFNYSSNFIHN